MLNLGLFTSYAELISTYSSGKDFIAPTSKWIDAVHTQSPPPLSIFTRVYYANSQYPDVEPGSPLAEALAEALDEALDEALAEDLALVKSMNPSADVSSINAANPASAIAPAFRVKDGYDVVMQHTRHYAGFANELEIILSSQHIDTVVIVNQATALSKSDRGLTETRQSGMTSSGTVLCTA